MINDIYSKSEQEVIEILQEHGIKVIMKPMALFPENSYNFEERSVGIIETDIYVALRKILVRNIVVGDPFS